MTKTSTSSLRWSGLKQLRCSQCSLAKPNLSVFSELRDLDLSYNPFTDEGMAGLAGLKNLKHLILRDTLVTDDGLKYLKDLTDLEELDLSGSTRHGPGLRVISADLKSMRSLNLLGAQVPDESMDILAGMKSLEVLNLYRTLVTNSGLASSAFFEKPHRRGCPLQPGHQQWCRSAPRGAARESRSASMEPLLPKRLVAGAAKPADSSAQAIAAWVRLMGGSAEVGGWPSDSH